MNVGMVVNQCACLRPRACRNGMCLDLRAHAAHAPLRPSSELRADPSFEAGGSMVRSMSLAAEHEVLGVYWLGPRGPLGPPLLCIDGNVVIFLAEARAAISEFVTCSRDAIACQNCGQVGPRGPIQEIQSSNRSSVACPVRTAVNRMSR